MLSSQEGRRKEEEKEDVKEKELIVFFPFFLCAPAGSFSFSPSPPSEGGPYPLSVHTVSEIQQVVGTV